MPSSSLLLVLLPLLLAGCPGGRAADPGETGPGTVRLTVLSTNDLHGQLEPLLRYTREASPRLYRVAGAEALAATVSALRARDPSGTILLDAGDFMQGSLISNRHEGAPIRELLSLLRYDAVALGNHEFDFGPVGERDPAPGLDPLGALKAWCRGAPFPVLSANLRTVDGTPLWPGLRRTAILERKGVKLGVIGLTTPKTATTTMPMLVRGLSFEPLLATAEREARALRAAGVKVVILLAHADAECDGPKPSSCRGEIFELLDRIEPGLVDVVVAGHSHRWIGQRYQGVLVVEGCSRGLLVGRLELVVDRARRRLDSAASRVLPPLRVCRDVFERSGSCEEPDGALGPILENPWLARESATVAAARAILERHRPEASDPVRRVVARSPRPLRHQLDGASEAGALFARSLLASVPGIDAAIFNAGSVRADLPAGAIRYADLYQSFPFDNKVATATLRGAELRRLIELLLSHSYGVPLVAGLQLRLRCGTRPGPRYLVTGLNDARGRPIEADRDYRIVLSDFLLTGGDGLGPVVDALPVERKQVHPRLVRDAIADQLASALLDPGPGPAVRIEDAPCRHWQREPGVRCE